MEARAKEESDFRNHRRGNDELLLQMHAGSSKIVDALAALKMTGLPALSWDHSYSDVGLGPIFTDFDGEKG